MDITVLISLIVGLAVGAAATGLATRSRVRAAELAVRAELADEVAGLRAANGALEASVAAERERVQDERARLEQLRSELQQSFTALSASALERNSKQFLELARVTMERQKDVARSELEQRQQAIEQLVRPLRESLNKVETQFGEIEKNRVGTEKQLLAQMSSLERTAGGLAQALRAPKTRGRWGEMHLRRVVEVAGMLDRCDFFEQESGTDGAGRRLQPDMVIRMAGGKSIAVDAKTPMDSYLAAMESEAEGDRQQALADHAQRVRAHVRELRGKEYARHLDASTTLVVLFLPTEDMFRAALEQDPALLEYAASHDVALATPSTLIVLLRSVAQGWREEALAENARRISEVGGELYNRICTLGEKFAKLGRSLNSSVKDYNDTLGSLEARVLPGARQLRELDVPAGKQLGDLSAIESSARELRAEELTASGVASLQEDRERADVVDTRPLTVVSRR